MPLFNKMIIHQENGKHLCGMHTQIGKNMIVSQQNSVPSQFVLSLQGNPTFNGLKDALFKSFNFLRSHFINLKLPKNEKLLSHQLNNVG